MKFYIPSYRRAYKQKTLAYLSQLGYSREEIVVATQTREDYDEYRRRYDGVADIIFRAGKGVSENRNTLMNKMRIGERAVMLDDDITRIDKLLCVGSARRRFGSFSPVTTRKELDSLIHSAFSLCERLGGLTWGMYSIHNERMMYGAFRRERVNLDRLFAGTFMGIIRTEQIFNTQYQTKEDYEYLLRQAQAGRPVVRLNWVSPYAEHFTRGGCEETRIEEDIFSAALLSAEFPGHVKQNAKKPAEVTQIAPLYKHGSTGRRETE